MQSPNRAYDPEVDQLRGLAALLVFFYHSLNTGYSTVIKPEHIVSNALTVLVTEGHTGVTLFMVLSGFILARGALGKQIAYGQFLKNRALRILPLMTFVLVFAIYSNNSLTLENIIAPFFFLANTPTRLFDDATNFSGAVWTISVEFQFYLIAPFLFYFVSKNGLKGFLLPAIAFVLCSRLIVMFPHRGAGLELYAMNYFTIIGRLNQFLIGIGLAYQWPKAAARLQRRGASFVALAALAAMIALLFLMNQTGGLTEWHWWRFIYPEIEALGWSVFILGYVLWRPRYFFAIDRALLTVGVLSFSVYILHWPLQLLFWSIYAKIGFGWIENPWQILVVSAFVVLPVILGMSALSYRCIERPFLDLRGRYLPSETRQTTASDRVA